MGLLDLAALPLEYVHRFVFTWFPAGVEVALWATLAGTVATAIYRSTSRQVRLKQLSKEVAAISRELAVYDGSFSGLRVLMKRGFGLAARQLAMTSMPALLASISLWCLLPWLSDTFDYRLPAAGDQISVSAMQRNEAGTAFLHWEPSGAGLAFAPLHWRVFWPAGDQPVTLRTASGEVLLRLPLSHAVAFITRRRPWNALVGSPVGYLPDDAPVDAIAIALPELELINWGPAWLRHWPAHFIAWMLVVSWALRRRWRLA